MIPEKYRLQFQRVQSAGAAQTAYVVWRRVVRRVGTGQGLRGANRGEALRKSLGLESLDAAVVRRLLFTDNAQSFFADRSTATAQLCRETFPESVTKTIEHADAVCRHCFSFLGKSAQFGKNIDWFWCPETGGSWPFLRVRAEKDVYNTPNKPGDIKYPWELNRHQYFVSLAQAYLYTGERRYADEIAAQIADWRARNPFPEGQNWVAMMEVGVRLLSWVTTCRLLRDTDAFDNATWLEFAQGIYDAGSWLRKNLTSDWLIPTNHVLGETAALFVAATLFPQFAESTHWQEHALRHFAEQIEKQVFEDGVNQEQATGYHRFVLDFLLMVVDTAERNGVRLPEVLTARLKAMLEYEHHLIGPDGLVPQIGDCDDGRGVILDPSLSFWDFRGWQAVAAVRYENPSYAAVAGPGNGEALWFLGPDRWRRFMASNRAPQRESKLFRSGGMAFLRRGVEPAETVVVMRCGPFGLGGTGACFHSHADLLAPVIYWQGEPLAVDTGTFAYYTDPVMREEARSTAFHNTFAPRGIEQARKYPTWDWDHVPDARVQWFEQDVHRAIVSAMFRTQQDFVHRRTVAVESKPLSIRFEDRITVTKAIAGTPLDWSLHLAPDIDVREDDKEAFVLSRRGRDIARLVYDGFAEARILTSWYSPAYGVTIPNLRLRLTAEGTCVQTRVVIALPR